MSEGEEIGVAIAVPARDEADRLPRLLTALAGQVDAPSFALCLFLDGCEDASAGVVASLAGRLPYRISVRSGARAGPPNAGLARACAMALAAETAPGGVLLTTDADGEPAPDWISRNLAALGLAEIVAGRIVRDVAPASARQDRVEAYLDRLHALRRAIDPVAWEAADTHHWTSGASLALHRRTYAALGGFPPVASGEDATLCDIAARVGYRIRRDADVVVRTSARRSGRAAGGFAAALAMLDDERHVATVHHPEDDAWRFHRQAEARRLHGTRSYAGLANRLGLPEAEVSRVASECRNGEAFAARIVGAPPGGLRHVNLAHADTILSAIEGEGLRGAA